MRIFQIDPAIENATHLPSGENAGRQGVEAAGGR
jgi:hypothetical protein